jgi:hypothetical protein
MKTMLIIGIPFLALATIAFGQDAAVMARLRNAVNDARDAKKSEYVQARNRLLALAKDTPAALATIRQSTNAWDVQLVCDIALERLQKAEAVEKAERWRPERIRDERAVGGRIYRYGKMLSVQSKDVPFLLVEKLWKGNEWNLIDGEDEEIGSVAKAIGILHIQEARRPLELQLRHTESDYDTRLAVVQAIGELRNPASAEPLLNYITNGFQGIGDISYRAAAEALSQCVKRESLPLLKETLRKIENGEVKDKQNELQSLLKLEIMALEK